MKKLPLFAAILFSGILLNTGCNNPDNPKLTSYKEGKPFNIDSAKKEIEIANREFIELFNKSDSVGLANMFTEDGKSMEPNEPAFNGRARIQTHYSIVMNAGANTLGLVTTGLWGDENMLAEEGEFTFTDKNGKLLDKGKYIVLWKKETGKWKLFRDCYNSDLPILR
jgi:ketosteroid isomerase-like protein